MMDERLAAVPDGPWGGRRFWPPGKHPAIAQLIRERGRIMELRELLEREGLALDNCDNMLGYVDQKIAEFEQAESEAKAAYAARFL